MDEQGEELADRVRERLHRHDDLGPVEEKAMFGGLSFLVHGHLAVAVGGQGGLLGRVPAEEVDELLARDHVEQMVMGSRRSKTWVRVDPAALRSDADLDEWIGRGLGVVRSLPPKHRTR